MATDKHVVTGDQYRIIDRRVREVKRQLDQEGGSPLDPAAVAKALQEIIEGRFSSVLGDLDLQEGSRDVLKLISGGENIVIDPTDGTEVLADANDVFDYIDGDFRNWEANEPGEATEEASVDVYELRWDTTFAQMFGLFSSDISTLCLSQSQIKGFCKKHREWLRSDDYGTFFLLKSHDNFLVAFVYVYSDGDLLVRVDKLENSQVWYVGDRRRVVVPQSA